MEVRSYQPQDAEALFEVCQNAIQQGAARHYTDVQRQAWADRFTTAKALDEKLAAQDALTGLRNGIPQGLMSRDRNVLDLAYVAPEAMGTGLAASLLAVCINRARVRGYLRLTTHASHPARVFFARQGWAFEAAQEVTLGGTTLVNHRMRLDMVAA